MKFLIKQLIAIIMLCSIFASCKKNSNSTTESKSKNVTFEVAGAFTGTLYVSYTTASGGTTNENATIPWNKAITYASTVDAAIISITGNGGIVGQVATIVVKQGGTVLSTTPATASGATGSFSVAAPVITF